MKPRDFPIALGAMALFMLLSPVLLVLCLFDEGDPADSYKYQNW